MNISESKLIRIVDYLSSLGYTPVKVRHEQYWYLSPLREEKSPSFKVDDRRNLWYDFGTADGGDLLELGKHLFHTSDVSTVLSKLSNTSTGILPFMRSSHVPQKSIASEIKILLVKPLNNTALLSYIRSRGISTATAQQYCQEIYYKWSDRRYFGVCFANQSGGYEVRNAYFKGCLKNKDITLVLNVPEERQQHICVFEGFMDFLTYLTMLHNGIPHICVQHSCDYLILNSVSNMKKCLKYLEVYSNIHCYLDNDLAGKKAVETIIGIYSAYVTDESYRYAEYKDVNDCLRGKLR